MTQLQHRTVYFPALPQEGQLNGLFSFLGGLLGKLIETAGKWIAQIITTLKLDSLIEPGAVINFTNGIAKKAKAVLSSIGGGSGSLLGPGTDITTAEYNWIKAYCETLLYPYIEMLLADLKTASEMPDDAKAIAAVNTILNKIAGINGHFDVEQDSLKHISEKARQQFQYFIYECLRPVFDGAHALAAEIGATPVKVTVTLSAYSYAPLFTKPALVSVNEVVNYKVQGTVPIMPATPPIVPVKVPVATTPATPTATVPTAPTATTPVTPVKATPVKTVTTGGTSISQTATLPTKADFTLVKESTTPQAQTGKTAAPGTKSNGLLIAAGIALGAWFLFGRKKKNKK